MRVSRLFVSALALIPVFASAQFDTGSGAAPKAPVGSIDRLLEPIQFRSVGPAVFGGRITDLEVHPTNFKIMFACAATGGIYKTINNGTTWKPVFDNYGAVSMGDMAISPSNPDIIYVGTGENTSTRSAHYGDGVYKSTDGGETWTNVGLKDSKRIGQIAVHPKDPNIVYVASMGYLYKGGGEKGIYKSTDGGKTWNQILKGENDTSGYIDVVMDPKNPNTLYAASHDRLRRAWNIRENGPGAAIHKTTDAGKTWKKLDGGLPKGDNVGRIGLAIYPKDPKQLYAFFDIKGQGGGGQVWRTKDAGNTWVRTSETPLSGGTYYCRVFVDPSNPEIVYAPNLNLMRSTDGGKTFASLGARAHVDWHTVWVDPNDSNHVRAANDGGLFYTYDAWQTNWFVNNICLAQFYAISADNATPYNIMGGTQDNGSWRGPSQTFNRGGIFNSHWETISGGDGFYNLAHPLDPDIIYTSSQFGAVSRQDMKSRAGRSIRPREQGQRANWMSPFAISPHAPDTIYWGANKLFKSLNRGDNFKAISPDLTTNDPEKIKGNVPHCTITTVDESRKKAGLLWVGTDDGNVWLTENDGVSWTQMNDKMTGAPKNYWVSRVHASPHDENTAWVTFTGFREDDWAPYMFKTTDLGKTWKRVEGLPNQQISVVKQDAINPNLLFAGTEAGLLVSLDGGTTWKPLNVGIATIPCQDLVIQERDNDLVVGTHGRGIFIADITPYRQLTGAITEKPFHLFKPTRGLSFNFANSQFEAFQGFMKFASANPQYGVPIWYHLKADSATDPKIEILNIEGAVVATLTGPKTAGLNKVQWNLRAGNTSAVGQYLVRITVGTETQTQTITVESLGRPTTQPGANDPENGTDDGDGL